MKLSKILSDKTFKNLLCTLYVLGTVLGWTPNLFNTFPLPNKTLECMFFPLYFVDCECVQRSY